MKKVELLPKPKNGGFLMAKKPKLPLAQAPCSECLKSARQTEKFIVAACPHNQAVAIMPIKDGAPEGMWRMFAPATLAEVLGVLKKSRLLAE